jgi:hypothetical protein
MDPPKMPAPRLGLVACALLTIVASTASAALLPPNPADALRVESTCRLVGQENRLAGKALDASVQTCVAAERPDLAVWEACRTKARHRGLKGPQLSQNVRNCLNETQ